MLSAAFRFKGNGYSWVYVGRCHLGTLQWGCGGRWQDGRPVFLKTPLRSRWWWLHVLLHARGGHDWDLQWAPQGTPCLRHSEWRTADCWTCMCDSDNVLQSSGSWRFSFYVFDMLDNLLCNGTTMEKWREGYSFRRPLGSLADQACWAGQV